MKLLITGSGTLLGNNVALEALKKHYIYASYRKSYPKNIKKKCFINKIRFRKKL